MRQKVGKERSQEGCAPLANPHRFLACPLRKFGPSPTPLRLCKPPVGVPSGTAEDGDSASRYFLRPKLSRDLPTTADATPLWTGLLLENRDRRSRAPPPPPAEGATSLLLRRLRGRLRKRTSPDGLCPRAWGKYFCFNSSLKQSISLLRRGARGDYPYELELRSGRAGRPYAGQAVPSGTRDWPSGRENSLCPRALGNPV